MAQESKARAVIIKGQIDLHKVCPVGMEYCWECGHVDELEVFLRDNKCPNPKCHNPSNWND